MSQQERWELTKVQICRIQSEKAEGGLLRLRNLQLNPQGEGGSHMLVML